MNAPKAELNQAIGRRCPHYVCANDQDYAYGRFLLDAASQKFVLQKIGDVHDVFSRSLLWGSLWNSVREAELAPREFIESAIRALPSETDESLAQNQLARIIGGLNSYVSSDVRAGFVPGLEAMAADRMLHAPEQDFRILWHRSVPRLAEGPAAGGKMVKLSPRSLPAGSDPPPALPPGGPLSFTATPDTSRGRLARA